MRHRFTIVGACVLALAACQEDPCGFPEDGSLASIRRDALRAGGITESALISANVPVVESMLAAMDRAPDTDARDWLVLVPGTSEEWGHHKAPPLEEEARGVVVSREFAARLERGFQLLEADVARYILISGGAVDPERPDYVEAERGRRYLLDTFSESWTHEEPLDTRVLVDTFAEHTTSNVRNADKLADELGLSRLLIMTTMPLRATLSPADIATQGYYLLAHGLSGFDARTQASFGYSLGRFHRVQFATAGVLHTAIAHCGFPSDALRRDAYGP